MNTSKTGAKGSAFALALALALAGLGAFSGFLAACSVAPMPVSHSQQDPSNPAALEGVSPKVASIAPSLEPRQPSLNQHDHHARGHESMQMQMPVTPAPAPASETGAPAPATEGTTYVCPMHPEVTSKTPGVCPKCNMKLVPKK